MRALLGVVAVAGAALVVYFIVSVARDAVGSRRDTSRIKRERNAALEGLNNVREIAAPYTSLGGDAALLADMIMTEIRKADDKLRKELT